MIGRDRQKGDTSAQGAQSWRELAGSRRARVNSRVARKRRWLPLIRRLGGVLLLLLIAGGLFKLVRMLDQGTREAVVAVTVKPIQAIRFHTDGVLTEDWR